MFLFSSCYFLAPPSRYYISVYRILQIVKQFVLLPAWEQNWDYFQVGGRGICKGGFPVGLPKKMDTLILINTFHVFLSPIWNTWNKSAAELIHRLFLKQNTHASFCSLSPFFKFIIYQPNFLSLSGDWTQRFLCSPTYFMWKNASV